MVPCMCQYTLTSGIVLLFCSGRTLGGDESKCGSLSFVSSCTVSATRDVDVALGLTEGGGRTVILAGDDTASMDTNTTD